MTARALTDSAREPSRRHRCTHQGLLVANRALKSVGSNPPPGTFRAFSGRWRKTSHNFSIQQLIGLLPLLVGIGTICALSSIEPQTAQRYSTTFRLFGELL